MQEEARGRRNRKRCWWRRRRSKCRLNWAGIHQGPADSKSSLSGCTWRLHKSQWQRRRWGSSRWGIWWNSRSCFVCWARIFANIATILRALSWRSTVCNKLLAYLPTTFLAVCLVHERRELAIAAPYLAKINCIWDVHVPLVNPVSILHTHSTEYAVTYEAQLIITELVNCDCLVFHESPPWVARWSLYPTNKISVYSKLAMTIQNERWAPSILGV